MVELRTSVEIKLTTVEGNYSTKISIQPCVSFTEMFLFNIFITGNVPTIEDLGSNPAVYDKLFFFKVCRKRAGIGHLEFTSNWPFKKLGNVDGIGLTGKRNHRVDVD